jgi:roadblock/LC7 domain-containing protein
MKLKGYIGHVKIDDKGHVKESDVGNAEDIASILERNVEKGNEEAKELGFSKLNGFAMFGSQKSITFMKNEAILVDTKKADWEDIFVRYTFIKSWLAGGIILVALSIIMFYLAIFTSYLDYFAPEPRLYTPTIILLIGVFMLALSKSKYGYRLD